MTSEVISGSQRAGDSSELRGIRQNIKFDARVFDVQAVKEALYKFSDRVTTALEVDGDQLICELETLKPLTREALDELVAALKVEVLDCDLRQTIRRETEPMRNLVLSLAFSKAGLNG